MTRSIQNFLASKEAYPIAKQLEKITVKNSQAKVVKCAKNKCWVPRTPLGHSSVKLILLIKKKAADHNSQTAT